MNKCFFCLKDALTKNFLSKNSKEIDTPFSLNITQKARPTNYKPQTTTLMMQRKVYCAQLIVRALRKYKEKTRKRLGEMKYCYLASFDEENLD